MYFFYGLATGLFASYFSKRKKSTSSKITYATIVCDHRPLKHEQWRCRLVVGGDKLFYNADTGAPEASLLDTKILLNSVISDAHKGAKFMSCDIKNYF